MFEFCGLFSGEGSTNHPLAQNRNIDIFRSCAGGCFIDMSGITQCPRYIWAPPWVGFLRSLLTQEELVIKIQLLEIYEFEDHCIVDPPWKKETLGGCELDEIRFCSPVALTCFLLFMFLIMKKVRV